MPTTWHNPVTTPPTPLRDYLLAYVHARPEEHDGERTGVSEGYALPGGGYEFATGHEATGVYAYAQIPAAPAPERFQSAPASPHHCARCGKLKLTRAGKRHHCGIAASRGGRRS